MKRSENKAKLGPGIRLRRRDPSLLSRSRYCQRMLLDWHNVELFRLDPEVICLHVTVTRRAL